MGRITVRQAAQWCGGRYEEKYADAFFLGANMDSRKLQPGQLFVALAGERDGHDFIPAALENGAGAVLCTRLTGDYPAIVVEDTRLALGRIAAHERQRLGIRVVGVTGSVGKSTTKEMIACVLEGDFAISKTPENFNNDIGLPMAILAIPEDTQVAVLEMGMDDFRQIAYLSGIARPDAAVITNIGTMHMEQLGSREGILKAKLEILEGMAADAPLFFNGDDDLLWAYGREADRDITYFGMKNEGASVFAANVEEKDGLLSFTVHADDLCFRLELPVEGQHYVGDALSAAAVALSMGVAPQRIQQRLGAFRNMAGRQEIFEAKGMTVIKDCYNAGPESMAAALAVLGRRRARRIAVLGDMLELGSRTAREHYRVGQIAAENADMVLAYGPNSSLVIQGAAAGGMTPEQAEAFDDRQKLARALKNRVHPGDVLLFKGSHGMHMELVLEQLLQEEA